MTAAGDVLAEVEAALTAVLGEPPSRASVSFLGVDPIEILRYVVGDSLCYVTLGMSRRPMTAGNSLELAPDGARAELMLQVHLRAEAEQAWRRLALFAAAPAVEGVVYAEGMTVDTGQPVGPGSRCTGGVLVGSAVAAIETSAGPVDVLRLVPATSSELAWARVRGSGALRELWDRQGVDLFDLGRAAATLDSTSA